MAPEGNARSVEARAAARRGGAPAATASNSASDPFAALSSTHPPVFAAGELVANRFRIVRFIAAGGMGEVYEAADEELHDVVALKTIRPEIARDEQALKRFRREVLLARKVTHPNVCRTFDVFRDHRAAADDLARAHVVFVTMELLAGETLAERLRRVGRMSATDAEPILAQIVSALTAAHAAGVVHRDLKSSNVMLLPASATGGPGRVVITDFGLASGSADAEGSIAESGSRILGTPAYMAPEQLEGGPITSAVDIYALGVLMFEMITGVRPFVGDTPFSTAVKRLYTSPPSARAVVPGLDPRWDSAIARCLARNPAERFATAGEIMRAVAGEVERTPSAAAGAPVRAPATARRRRTLSLGAAGAILLAVALAGWRWLPPQPPSMLWQGQLVLLVSSEQRASDPAISPDGRLIAYVAEADDRVDLFVVDARGEGRLRLTDDSAREEDPQISPDGSRVVFTRVAPDASVSEIWSVPLLGGQLAALVRGAAYPAWSPDGTRLAFVHRPAPDAPLVLATANADGSNVRTVLRVDGPYLNIRAPAWSPDGQEIAFIRGRGGVSGELWVVPAEGGAPRQVSQDPAAVFSDEPVYTPDGAGILHSSNRGGATNIWLIPRSGGAPARVTTGTGPDERPSVARDGAIAFASSRWRNVLLVHDLSSGSVRTIVTHSRFLWAPAFSPDNRELAYSQGEIDGSWHIWIASAAGDAPPRRLTATADGEVYPRFTADGAYVMFQSWSEPRRIWRVPRAGGPPARMPNTADGDAYADMAPDGRTLAFVRSEADGEHVYVASVDGGPARRLVADRSSVPRWSPDGEWITFARDRDYSGGVFVVRRDGTALRRLSNRGGWPVWWPDGRKVAYLTVGADGNQVVEVVPFAGGKPRRLDFLRYAGTNNPIDISPDGAQLATGNGSHVSDEIWLLQPDSK